jgi:hypothetical protein
MLKTKRVFFIIFIMFMFFNISPNIVKAGSGDWYCSDGTSWFGGNSTKSGCEASCPGSLGTTFSCRQKSVPSGGSAGITNPLGEGTTPQKLIGRIIEAALGIVGSIALVMFIYGGFTWMLAAGNAEAVSKGKNILIWSVIGLVIIFFSYALLQFVFTSLGV